MEPRRRPSEAGYLLDRLTFELLFGVPHKDPEERRRYMSDYVERNREKHNESNRRSYRRNREARLAATRRWAEANPERLRELHRIRTFGVSPERFVEMWAEQEGLCANPGCDTPLTTGTGGCSIDHDHACCPGPKSCGRCVRGLLCGACNKAAGLLRDDPERALGLAAYIEASRDALTERTG